MLDVDTITLKSPAKVNLYLDVLGRRKDGYHNIETVFEKINLTDEIKIKKIPRTRLQAGQIAINCNRKELASRDNLAYKAAEILVRDFKIAENIEIAIDKRVPVSAGLGGGSSNAAAVLSGINELFGLGLSSSQLAMYAGSLGADVGFFVNPGAFALGRGRGDEIHPINSDLKLWHLVINPPIAVSAKEVYNGLILTLTKENKGVNLTLSAIERKDVALIERNLYNRLEEVTSSRYAAICEIKQALGRAGVKANVMAGSGPSVFGLIRERQKADKIKQDFLNQYPDWRVFVVDTFGERPKTFKV